MIVHHLTMLGAEKWTQTFTAQTSWTPPMVWDIPAKFPGNPKFLPFKTQETETLREAWTFWPPPLRVEDPPPPTGGLRTQKVYFFALLSCLRCYREINQDLCSERNYVTQRFLHPSAEEHGCQQQSYMNLLAGPCPARSKRGTKKGDGQ